MLRGVENRLIRKNIFSCTLQICFICHYYSEMKNKVKERHQAYPFSSRMICSVVHEAKRGREKKKEEEKRKKRKRKEKRGREKKKEEEKRKKRKRKEKRGREKKKEEEKRKKKTARNGIASQPLSTIYPSQLALNSWSELWVTLPATCPA